MAHHFWQHLKTPRVFAVADGSILHRQTVSHSLRTGWLVLSGCKSPENGMPLLSESVIDFDAIISIFRDLPGSLSEAT